MAKLKDKKCKICKKEFKPFKSTDKYCSFDCKKQEPKKPKTRSEVNKALKKPKSKPIGKLLKEFQEVFNAYIRQRDKGKPCISCGEYNVLQAGHYFAVSGYKGLRFDEDNCHGEGACCNMFNESHLILYGINLKQKIGDLDYNALLRRAQAYKKGTLFNEYYQNGKWNREGILKGIEYYKSLLDKG